MPEPELGFTVHVGLGSNLEPERNVNLAVSLLAARFGGLQCSNVYRSPAYGFVGPDFLNLVVAFQSTAGPAAVEAELTEIESARGRGMERRGGSRTLDLDLLLYGAAVDAVQRLPRDDVLRYPFVLAPLSELAPGLRHPVTGISIAAAWLARRDEEPLLQCLGPLAAA